MHGKGKKDFEWKISKERRVVPKRHEKSFVQHESKNKAHSVRRRTRAVPVLARLIFHTTFSVERSCLTEFKHALPDEIGNVPPGNNYCTVVFRKPSAPTLEFFVWKLHQIFLRCGSRLHPYTPTPIESINPEGMTDMTTDVPLSDSRNLMLVVPANKPIALINNDESYQAIRIPRDMEKMYTLTKTRDELLTKVVQLEEALGLADRVYKGQVARITELENTAHGLTVWAKICSKSYRSVTSANVNVICHAITIRFSPEKIDRNRTPVR